MTVPRRPLPFDLFMPGRGSAPPFMAGRDREMNALRGMLPRVGGKPPPSDGVLIGPRGNGKTVLLGEFARLARAAGCDVVKTTPETLQDEGALIAWLLKPVERPPENAADPESLLARLPPAAAVIAESVKNWKPRVKSLGIPGLFALEFARMDPADQQQTLLYLADLLAEACRERPRAAILDEAHTLKPELARALLNAAQNANEKGASFLLVLAGTPQLPAKLKEADATFWERCLEIGVCALSDSATREALEKPLAEYGVSFDAQALDAIVEDSQRYPYFIQLWGQALCETLAPEAARIDAATAAKARARVAVRRATLYAHRRGEIKDAGLLLAAAAVADFYDRLPPGAAPSDDDVEGAIGASLDVDAARSREIFNGLRDYGYLWEPPLVPGSEDEEIVVEPGIPSLMSYVLDKRGAPAP